MNSHFSNQTQRKFCRLPTEILLGILKKTRKFSDKVKLVSTCRKLYYVLILEAGKKFQWLPMIQAAEDRNCRTLARCIEAGAPIDYRSPLYHSRPLVVAIRLSRPLTVKWLLDHGANPNGTSDDDGTSEAPCPLAQAVEYAVRPGILRSHIPRRWKRKGIKIPSYERHQRTSREIIKALRQAGADEQPLGDTERLHLDSIEGGTPCCSQHKPRLWYQRRRGHWPWLLHTSV
ncbi:hypothetical protein FDENT_13137 [Fusarium denticulatum]|uniref:F-box domain-containing protein n=1 Tax=Fusarium denticulatum TaxID=48507 RepID=A0A8H5T5H2_9HYPO|nr:hypothetical protein FDENT_13137 [Fusarium denticulatum]